MQRKINKLHHIYIFFRVSPFFLALEMKFNFYSSFSGATNHLHSVHAACVCGNEAQRKVSGAVWLFFFWLEVALAPLSYFTHVNIVSFARARAHMLAVVIHLVFFNVFFQRIPNLENVKKKNSENDSHRWRWVAKQGNNPTVDSANNQKQNCNFATESFAAREKHAELFFSNFFTAQCTFLPFMLTAQFVFDLLNGTFGWAFVWSLLFTCEFVCRGN